MSAPLVLTPHQKDLGGGFLVRRTLPAAQRRAVGPFVFFDHFGPATEHPEVNHDVRPHPHIGLATVTYLFEGAILHRDSLGTVQEITPGALNWMTAGRGIVHSERRPPRLAQQDYVNHGLQLWAALPLAHEEAEPAFSHTSADALPETAVDDARVRVLVGEAFGLRSPVATLAPTLYLDVQLPAGGTVTLPPLAREMAVYAVEGALRVAGADTPVHTMAVLAPGADTAVQAAADAARFVVIGGDPLEGHRHMWWNFVSSRKERIAQAADDWEARRMGGVDGDAEFIPLPERRFL